MPLATHSWREGVITTSGSYAFNPSSGQCTLAAYERIGIRAPSIRPEHMNTAILESNLAMVKFSNLQPNLWKVTLTSQTLTATVASYAIPSNVVMILDAYISQNFGTPNQTDLYITPVSRTEYASYANKQTPGRPTSFWFDRTPPNQTAIMWPVPDANGPYTLNYYACLQMQDVALAGGQTLDVPYLWLDAYIAELAHRFARVYKPELEAVRKADAKEAWTEAAGQNVENVSLSVAPSIKTYYRR
jgi:hypothetical protein